MRLSSVLSSDEVINYEKNGGYNPMDIYQSVIRISARGTDAADQMVLTHTSDPELFRDLYNSLLNTQCSQYGQIPTLS